jgi:hypothetical protein
MIAPVRPTSTGRDLAVSRSASQAGTGTHRVEPIARVEAVRIDRRADFLAHLIATRDGLPQTRIRRRAEPSEAAAAYGRSAKDEVCGIELFISV